MPSTPTPLLTTDQAAEYLACSPRTLEGWRIRGDGPRYVRVGRTAVRYRLADLDVWIESVTFEHTAAEHAAG